MKFTWDESKRLRNIRKHGIDFADGASVFNGTTMTMEDLRFAYEEQRFITFGLLHGQVVAIAHTETGTEIRIISMRKARLHEQETFFKNVIL